MSDDLAYITCANAKKLIEQLTEKTQINTEKTQINNVYIYIHTCKNKLSTNIFCYRRVLIKNIDKGFISFNVTYHNKEKKIFFTNLEIISNILKKIMNKIMNKKDIGCDINMINDNLNDKYKKIRDADIKSYKKIRDADIESYKTIRDNDIKSIADIPWLYTEKTQMMTKMLSMAGEWYNKNGKWVYYLNGSLTDMPVKMPYYYITCTIANFLIEKMEENKNKSSDIILFDMREIIFIVDENNQTTYASIIDFTINTNQIGISKKDSSFISINLSDIFIKDINTNHDCYTINNYLSNELNRIKKVGLSMAGQFVINSNGKHKYKYEYELNNPIPNPDLKINFFTNCDTAWDIINLIQENKNKNKYQFIGNIYLNVIKNNIIKSNGISQFNLNNDSITFKMKNDDTTYDISDIFIDFDVSSDSTKCFLIKDWISTS